MTVLLQDSMTPSLLQVILPRVLQALLGVVCDVYVFRIATLHYGQQAGQYAVSFVCTTCVYSGIGRLGGLKINNVTLFNQ